MRPPAILMLRISLGVRVVLKSGGSRWAMLWVGLAGCNVTTPHQIQTKDPLAQPSIRVVGRAERGTGQTVHYAWSGSGIVARFRGTGATVQLNDDKNHHQVVLDGRPTKDLVTSSGVGQYVVADGLPAGEHRLELYRRTEALFGVTSFLGVQVHNGELLPPDPLATRRIEIVGDSISCGYGNEGASPDCAFSAQTENHYLSYGAILARLFNAELSTVAWSGRGVVKNYNGEPGELMPVLYDRTLPEASTSNWKPSEPYHAVIVNLGSNDFSTEPDPEISQFVAGYVGLLSKIRAHHPDAFVLCTVGPMLTGPDRERAESGIAAAVAARNSAGDRRIEAFRMRTQNDNPGCDWHPGLATHQRIAEELAMPLRHALHW